MINQQQEIDGMCNFISTMGWYHIGEILKKVKPYVLYKNKYNMPVKQISFYVDGCIKYKMITT